MGTQQSSKVALGVTQVLKQNNPEVHGGESGAWFTDCRCLEMGCQEDGCEAEEGGQAGGISAAACAVPVEDVDLGRLKAEAGIDLKHRAGPGEGERVAGAGWTQAALL